ncbi:hypothetical protein [Halalkalibacter alkalisediminis]|uniref:Uncharacterized protein n=1 Tax=Halalkalibacter alkalisediminis TaxID=935616 RepID=A0ABV6NKY4_9BACI|nr:hypothetical protein [Halalkalibacter alkalisediminis]
MKNFMKYIIWTVVIGIIYYIGFRFQFHFKEEAHRNFNMLPAVIYGTFLPVFFGILLRLPRLITEIYEKKEWTVNWAKLITIGLPTLYITFVPLLSFTFLGKYIPFMFEIILLEGTTISGLILGYVLLDSIKKQ